jgi:hypothetical protein
VIVETKWASLIPFAKVADVLREVLPVETGTNHETIRRHLQATAQRMEDELGEERLLSVFEGEADEPDQERRPTARSPWALTAAMFGRPTRRGSSK